MQSANKKIEDAVERIVEKGQKDEETIKEARKEVEEYRSRVDNELEELEKQKEKQVHDRSAAGWRYCSPAGRQHYRRTGRDKRQTGGGTGRRASPED